MVSSPSDEDDDRWNESGDIGANDHPHSLWWHAGRVADRFGDLLLFALIPLLTTLLNARNVRRSLRENRGFSINFEFALPSTLLDLWSFVDPPEPATRSDIDGVRGAPTGGPADSTVDADSPAGIGDRTTSSGADLTVDTPLEVVTVPLETMGLTSISTIALGVLLYGVLLAVLEAIYVGGIDRRLRNERLELGRCIRQYAPRLFLYTLVVFGAILSLIPVVLVLPVLFIVALPAAFVLGYLFYAVPFLFVVDDARFLEAFERSYGFAIEGGSYFGFALRHVAVAVVASATLSLLVSFGGPAGFLLVLLLATPLALLLTATTVSFLRELVELDGGERRPIP